MYLKMWRLLQNCPPSVDLEELLRHLMAQNVKSIRGRIVIDSSMKYIFFYFILFFFSSLPEKPYLIKEMNQLNIWPKRHRKILMI